MTKENEYGALRLKASTLEYLRIMKQAFEMCYGKDFSNDDFILHMAAAVEGGDCAVYETFCELQELREKAKQRRKDGKWLLNAQGDLSIFFVKIKIMSIFDS